MVHPLNFVLEVKQMETGCMCAVTRTHKRERERERERENMSGMETAARQRHIMCTVSTWNRETEEEKEETHENKEAEKECTSVRVRVCSHK